MNSAEDAQIVLYSILEEVVNGRVDGHRCPFCLKGTLHCDLQDGTVRIRCDECEQSFEGVLR